MNFHLCLSIPINSLWEALNVEARSPDKFMDVSSVKVSDEDGFLVRSMTLTSNNTTVNVRIWINPVISEIVFFSLHTQTLTRQVARGACEFQCERSRICTLCSTREMSRMECGHPGNFLLTLLDVEWIHVW